MRKTYLTCNILTIVCAIATVVVCLVKGDIAGAVILPLVIGIGVFGVFFGAKNPGVIARYRLGWKYGKCRFYKIDSTAVPEERLKMSAAIFALIFALALFLLQFC